MNNADLLNMLQIVETALGEALENVDYIAIKIDTAPAMLDAMAQHVSSSNNLLTTLQIDSGKILEAQARINTARECLKASAEELAGIHDALDQGVLRPSLVEARERIREYMALLRA